MYKTPGNEAGGLLKGGYLTRASGRRVLATALEVRGGASRHVTFFGICKPGFNRFFPVFQQLLYLLKEKELGVGGRDPIGLAPLLRDEPSHRL